MVRTGIGYDIHRLIPTIKPSTIPLGGVDINCFFKLEAHSDGDVLLHAIVDACLGALALGDIGTWFPDKDELHQNRPSSEFIKRVLVETGKLGWEIYQVDSTIFLEEPKLGSYRELIRQNLAKLLNIEISSVSVKAKTKEGLGAVGEKLAIEAQALVMLRETTTKTTHRY